jgi:glycosyltransferase involved in cell wall biosynthesis
MKLSVITICLNEAGTIERTIQSVLGQTFVDYEYIIIDGGSQDGALDIINKYANRITHFISGPDSGVFNAQNKGIKLSSGEYLLFLNAGDYLSSPKILEQIFSVNYDSDILYGDIFIKLNSESIFKKKLPEKMTKNYLFNDTLPHQASLIKKELFNRIGLYDEKFKFASDYDFFLKAIYQNKSCIEYIPLPISVYNLKGKSSRIKNRNKLNAERRLSQKSNFNKSTYYIFRFLKPFYQVFIKYPRFAFQILFYRMKPFS